MMHPEEFPNDQNDPGELGRAEAVAARLVEEGYDNAAETIRRLIRRVERRDARIASMRSKIMAVFDGPNQCLEANQCGGCDHCWDAPVYPDQTCPNCNPSEASP